MALERRGDKVYYYRKHWTAGRVVSEYVGSGAAAEQAAQAAAAARAPSRRAILAEIESADDALLAFAELIETLTAGTLLLSGYHQPKRQWRRRRAGSA
jgi:hypothetical protein